MCISLQHLCHQGQSWWPIHWPQTGSMWSKCVSLTPTWEWPTMMGSWSGSRSTLCGTRIWLWRNLSWRSGKTEWWKWNVLLFCVKVENKGRTVVHRVSVVQFCIKLMIWWSCMWCGTRSKKDWSSEAETDWIVICLHNLELQMSLLLCNHFRILKSFWNNIMTEFSSHLITLRLTSKFLWVLCCLKSVKLCYS